MAIIPGIDFSYIQWDNGTTKADQLAYLADKGVRFGIAKVGQARFLDGRWDEHKARLEAIGDPFVKGGYWFLQRDFPAQEERGFFYPPFAEGVTHRTSSYGIGWTTPTRGHNDYAVDLNDVDGSDEGQAVRAAAAGTVVARTVGRYENGFPAQGDTSFQRDTGTVLIDHPGGYRTQYTHMKDITVNGGDEVKRGDKIGEISTVGSTGEGDPAWAHLHHIHFRKKAGRWRAIKMEILGERMTASKPDTISSHEFEGQRWEGQNVTGVRMPSGDHAYTGRTQADRFLHGLDPVNHDPSGWLCALDVEGLRGSTHGLPPLWRQVRQFIEEFHRQAPGYPLWLYARASFWNSSIRDGGRPADAKAAGFAHLWNADWTQVDGSIGLAEFDTAGQGLSFAAGFAGFRDSTLLQWGSPDEGNGLRFFREGKTYRIDGDAFDGSERRLRGLATGTGDPDPVPGAAPNLHDVVEPTALATLTDAGFVAGTRNEEHHVRVVAGRVTRTEPPAATLLQAGGAVAYWVSIGPRPRTRVPDVVGTPEDSALAAFATMRLVAGTRTTAAHPTVPRDFMISTAPGVGTSMAIGSEVDYVVSLGPPSPAGMPDPIP